MFISPISQIQNVYISHKQDKRLKKASYDVKTDSLIDNVSFRAFQKAEVAKNQIKILLTQDIWAPKLKIKMPESIIEKEALLEVLTHRAKLDKLVRLKNDRFKLLADLSELKALKETEPNSPLIAQIQTELNKRGNINSILNTMNKQIEQEEKRNQPALKYFEDISKLEENYLARKLVKLNHMERFWHKTLKNNINPEGKYSASELIEIIKSGEIPNAIEVKATTPILSRKDLLAKIEKEYEQLMRERINVYATAKENMENANNQYQEAKGARETLQAKYANALKRHTGIENSLKNAFTQIERKYIHKVDRLVNTNIYPIGQIWDEMRPLEKSIKKLMREIPELQAKAAKAPENQTLKMSIAAKEVLMIQQREDWLMGAKQSVNYESINRSRMVEAGKVQEYDYLTSENKTIKRHKLAVKYLEENNGHINEAQWAELLG